MDKLGFLQDLFDQKLIKIIRVFMAEQKKQFYLKEVSDISKVPIATTHRTLKKLTNLEIISETSISKFKVYQLANNEKVTFLTSFIKETVRVANVFASRVQDIESIGKVIMHGKEGQNRANILLIGEKIDATQVKAIVADIKEQYDFYVSYMALTEEQYEQMSNMGLYSGSKKILFERN